MNLQTARLILRPFKSDDIPKFCEIDADPAVMKYFSRPRTSDETVKMLADWSEKLARHGYAFCAVETRHDKQLIGIAGLSRLEEGVQMAPCTEIGWRLTSSAWHKGYATEAACAWLNYGFERLGLTEILAYTPKLNVPSQRVMQRIGMQRAEHLDFDFVGLSESDPLRPFIVYRLQ